MWRPGRSKTLKKEALILDAESSHGAFAEASAAFEFPEGEGLPGRCFKLRDVEHCASLQSADSNDPRADIAKDNGVRGAFAIFRDGAVWEFGGTPPMSEKPQQLIDGIGGSTGVRAAAKAVQAVVRLKAMGKSKSNAAAAAAAAAQEAA